MHYSRPYAGRRRLHPGKITAPILCAWRPTPASALAVLRPVLLFAADTGVSIRASSISQCPSHRTSPYLYEVFTLHSSPIEVNGAHSLRVSQHSAWITDLGTLARHRWHGTDLTMVLQRTNVASEVASTSFRFPETKSAHLKFSSLSDNNPWRLMCLHAACIFI